MCWNSLGQRIKPIVFAFAVALALTTSAAGRADARPAASADPPLATVLARYQRAIADPGAPLPATLESSGFMGGAGLVGRYHEWRHDANDRFDETLGPRTQRTYELGDRMIAQNGDGNVRALTGVLLRRATTQRRIDDGSFAEDAAHCRFAGTTLLDHKRAYLIVYAPPDGQAETLALDAASGLPVQIAYDDDDGTATTTLSDWRSIGGRRYAFHAVASNGDVAYDVVLQTDVLTVDGAIEPSVFVPPVNHAIEMAAPQTMPLEVSEGHLYVPVTIGGKVYRFLLDSGAQNIVVDTHVAREAGLQRQGDLEASGAARTGGLQLAPLSELRVGEGRLRDLVVTTLDLGASTQKVFAIDGILGYPFFASATVRLDLNAHTLTFGPPGSLPVSGERIAVDVDRQYPEAKFRPNGGEAAPFIVDTGNAGEVLLYHPYLERHGSLVAFAPAGGSSYGIGGAMPSYRTALDELDIGTVPLYHLDTEVMLARRGAFADRFDAGNVGLGILRNFIVTFDESAGALYLERSPIFNDGRDRRR